MQMFFILVKGFIWTVVIVYVCVRMYQNLEGKEKLVKIQIIFFKVVSVNNTRHYKFHFPEVLFLHRMLIEKQTTY